MWLRTLLLAILILFVIRALRRLLGGVIEGAVGTGPARSSRRQRTPVKMVADPVCGTYVIPGKALQLARGGETVYFCSEKCRDNWAASR